MSSPAHTQLVGYSKIFSRVQRNVCYNRNCACPLKHAQLVGYSKMFSRVQRNLHLSTWCFMVGKFCSSARMVCLKSSTGEIMEVALVILYKMCVTMYQCYTTFYQIEYPIVCNVIQLFILLCITSFSMLYKFCTNCVFHCFRYYTHFLPIVYNIILMLYNYLSNCV